jgi:hypothetical protein
LNDPVHHKDFGLFSIFLAIKAIQWLNTFSWII